MDITNSKNINTGRINTKGGDVRIGDDIYHFKGAEYEAFLERIKEYEEFLEDCNDEVKRLKYSEKLEKERQKLRTFKNEIIQLAELFQKIDIDTQRLRLAKKHFDAGEFKEARVILDAEQMTNELENLLDQKAHLAQKTAQNETRLIDKANEFLILAKLTAINYEIDDWFEKAKEYFEKSLSAYRSFENTGEFAMFLEAHNELEEAMKYYQEILKIFDKKTKKNNQSESYISSVFNSMAIIHSKQNAFEKAAEFYNSALNIQQKLDYNPDIAITLNNIGNIFKAQNEFDKAETTYHQALKIRESLIQIDKEAYLPALGISLYNMAVLYHHKKEFQKAETSFNKALTIRQALPKTNTIYIQDLAMTNNGLANLYEDLGQFKDAEIFYLDALNIYQQLAQTNPYTYLPYKASTLSNLATFYKDNNGFEQSEEMYNESIKIYRNLADVNPNSYLPQLATVLGNLAILLNDQDELEKAEKLFNESLKIQSKLTKDNPNIHLPILANTLHNFACLLHKNKPKESEKVFNKALAIRRNLSKDYPQIYLPALLQTLNSICPETP